MSFAPVLGIDITQVHDVPEFRAGQHGAVIGSPTKLYKYVQYDTGDGSVAAVSGQACYYYLLTGYENSVVTSDLSDSNGGSNKELGAGILQSAPTDGQFCWIQIKGPATMSIALTAGDDGDALSATGATDGTLDLSNAVTHIDKLRCAYAIDASEKKIMCEFPF